MVIAFTYTIKLFLIKYKLVAFSRLSRATSVSLLSNAELDTLALGQRDQRLGALTNDKDVRKTSNESVIERVLDVDNIEATLVTLTVGDDTNTSQIASTGGHDDITVVELDERLNLASSKINLDSVVDLDGRIGVANGAAIMCNEVGDSLLTKLNTLDLTELVLSFLSSDSVDSETTLNVVDETEVLTSLLKGDDIHETSGESGVGSNLVVNLDKSLHEDRLDFTAVKSVLQTVSKEDNNRKRFSKFVGTGRGSGGVSAGKLVQHPVGWSCQTLQMLLTVRKS